MGLINHLSIHFFVIHTIVMHNIRYKSFSYVIQEFRMSFKPQRNAFLNLLIIVCYKFWEILLSVISKT